MVKNCKVLINNGYVTVILFGETKVQIPAINKDVDTVRIRYQDGRYSVVADDYVEPTEEITVEIPKKKGKKTTKKSEFITEEVRDDELTDEV